VTTEALWIWQQVDWPNFHWADDRIIDGQSISSLLRENHQRLGRLLGSSQVKILNRLLNTGPVGFESGINARKYSSLTRTSKATTTRDLADLLQKGCLSKLPGGGRSTRYAINWSGRKIQRFIFLYVLCVLCG
jgi:Fic family protein